MATVSRPVQPGTFDLSAPPSEPPVWVWSGALILLSSSGLLYAIGGETGDGRLQQNVSIFLFFFFSLFEFGFRLEIRCYLPESSKSQADNRQIKQLRTGLLWQKKTLSFFFFPELFQCDSSAVSFTVMSCLLDAAHHACGPLLALGAAGVAGRSSACFLLGPPV